MSCSPESRRSDPRPQEPCVRQRRPSVRFSIAHFVFSFSASAFSLARFPPILSISF
jgi:hypothetical protein